ncbi:MAG: hypothetical protein ABSD57_10350 [Verrucomicrobiota bacterium]|jgi:hypothetical protein
MSDSYKPILDREYSAEMVQHFKDILDLLDEVLDYGSFLLPRAYGSSPKDIKANCLVFALFGEITSPNPLREPEDIAKLAKFAIPIAWRVYELILKQYRSGEANDNFPRKVAEWQPRFRKEYSVELSPKYTII